MNSFIKLLSLLFAFLIFNSNNSALAEIVNLTLLQLNDVYEIEPIAGGKLGGLARVANLRKELLRHNKNTYTILVGVGYHKLLYSNRMISLNFSKL